MILEQPLFYLSVIMYLQQLIEQVLSTFYFHRQN